MNDFLKNKKGITIIALVITIIVLLILAGVTIQTLTGDNGLLQKVGEAKEKSQESKICENIQLAYAEYQIAQYDDTDKTAEEVISNNLKKIYGNDVKSVNLKNENVVINMQLNGNTKTYIYKTVTGIACEYVDPFDYGEYTKSNIPIGADITLDTEKFRVFSNENGVIEAMPFYNIELKLDNPKQSQTAGTIAFSESSFWNLGENINMLERKDNNPGYKNNIQQYIEAYQNTLENLGASLTETRRVKLDDIAWGAMTPDCANPGQVGNFWEATSYGANIDYVYFASERGEYWSIVECYNDKVCGVRPIIVIDY